jgi:hypothetical protein
MMNKTALAAVFCLLSAACKQPPGNEPAAAELSPAQILADYGKTWAFGGDLASLRPGLSLMRAEEASALSVKLLDYYVCESLAKRSPAPCRAAGMEKLPPASPGGFTSFSMDCSLHYAHYRLFADLLQGKDSGDACFLYQTDGTGESSVSPAASLANSCAQAAAAYKKDGFPAVCRTFEEGDPEERDCATEDFPVRPEDCKAAPRCLMHASMLNALKDRNPSACPPAFQASCRSLIDAMNGKEPGASCKEAESALTAFHRDAPRVQSAGLSRR